MQRRCSSAPCCGAGSGTIDKVCQAIEKAASHGAEFIVFPETVVPYYPYFSIHPAAGLDGGRAPSALRRVGDSTERRDACGGRGSAALGGGGRAGGQRARPRLTLQCPADFRCRWLAGATPAQITPTYHERMVWGQGDGSGLKVVETRVGRVGALACWEHYNPLARYALMAQHEAIHASMFPGQLVGPIFAEQIQVTIRHHALESGCFVVNATGWLTAEQQAQVAGKTGLERAITGGCFTAIVAPDGSLLGTPLTEGEGMVIADLDLALITKRKRMMDSVGHYSRPELLSLLIDRSEKGTTVERAAPVAYDQAMQEPLPNISYEEARDAGK